MLNIVIQILNYPLMRILYILMKFYNVAINVLNIKILFIRNIIFLKEKLYK